MTRRRRAPGARSSARGVGHGARRSARAQRPCGHAVGARGRRRRRRSTRAREPALPRRVPLSPQRCARRRISARRSAARAWSVATPSQRAARVVRAGAASLSRGVTIVRRDQGHRARLARADDRRRRRRGSGTSGRRALGPELRRRSRRAAADGDRRGVATTTRRRDGAAGAQQRRTFASTRTTTSSASSSAARSRTSWPSRRESPRVSGSASTRARR